MSQHFGREILAIPGPSIMPDRVLAAMHRASPNIYEGELIDMTASLYPDLKKVARTEGEAAIYIANGHGAWEAALKNTLRHGDRVLVLAAGRFAAGWGDVARTLGIEIEVLDFGMQGHADPQRLEERLRADGEGKIRAVLTVQTDTASSVLNPVADLRKAIDAAGHDALYMVDCIASLGCDRFEMDQWGVDLMVAACQKGLMTPAGLGFVFFNERADEARQRCEPGFYWDWTPRARPELFYQQFGGTAPTHHLFGLREALNILVHEEGMNACWQRHEKIARAVWAALDAWDKSGQMIANIAGTDYRSRAVTTVATGSGEAAKLRAHLEDHTGVTLGIGLGFGEPGSEPFNSHFRIGHMGHQNAASIMGVLGSIEVSLNALGLDHGPGALEAAAKELASQD